ncbi:MAG: DUF2156 domain-containing protein [Saccharofermentanales bacterium]|jgi:hypothetical protein
MLCSCFEPFNPDDIESYDHHFRKTANEISDSFTNSRVAWNPAFNYQKSVIGDLFCLISDGGVFTTPHMTMPVGKLTVEGLQKVIDVVAPHFECQNWPFRILYIEERDLPLFDSLQGYKVSFKHDECYSDYIYEAESLMTLAGKALHAKRNHVNRFFRNCPDFSYDSITKADEEGCLELVNQWCTEKGIDKLDIRDSDYLPIKNLFAFMDQLQVRGGVIRLGEEIVAFAMGSAARDLGVIHFEKARTDIDGLYAVINKLVVEHEFADCTEINREEDMGIEGLRKAKQSYVPKRMVKKYEALVTRE